jgi:fatty-acid desaturase
LDWLSNGLWDLSAWQLVVVTLVLTHITIVSVTVYLHRHSAHRAVDLHPALQHFFRLWLWLTTGMNTKEWTAIHRKHHAVCETEEDPHSPQIQGLKKIFWQGAEVYRDAATPETLKRYGAGTPDDWMERNVYSRFTVLGISLMVIIDVALFGAVGLTIWAVQMMWIPVTAAGIINGIGHYWGYRNFECPDAATNIVPWGIIIGGEELHNNHHTYPNSAKLSQKPWEFDIGWMYIRVFEMLGLAKARSVGPVVEKVPGKSTLDMDTAWAVLNDRFRVMAKYAEDVVSPLLEQELDRAGNATRGMVRGARRLLFAKSS